MKVLYFSVLIFFGAPLGLCSLSTADDKPCAEESRASLKHLIPSYGRIDGSDVEFEKVLAHFKSSLCMPPARELPRGAVRDYAPPPLRDCLSVIFEVQTPNLSSFGVRNITVSSGYFIIKKGRTTFIPSPLSASADFMIPLVDDRYFQLNLPLSLINIINEVTVSLVYRLEDEDIDCHIQKTFKFLEDPKPPITAERKKKGRRTASTLEGYVHNVQQIWLALINKDDGLEIVQRPSIKSESREIATDKNSLYRDPAMGGMEKKSFKKGKESF